MDNFRVNETTPLSSVNQTNQTQPVDDSFRFTLTSAIADADLQAKVERMLQDINVQGKSDDTLVVRESGKSDTGSR